MSNLFIESDYEEEWYQPELTCDRCKGLFMTSGEPTFCPYCGIEFVGKKSGNTYSFKFEDDQNGGDNNNQNSFSDRST